MNIDGLPDEVQLYMTRLLDPTSYLAFALADWKRALLLLTGFDGFRFVYEFAGEDVPKVVIESLDEFERELRENLYPAPMGETSKQRIERESMIERMVIVEREKRKQEFVRENVAERFEDNPSLVFLHLLSTCQFRLLNTFINVAVKDVGGSSGHGDDVLRTIFSWDLARDPELLADKLVRLFQLDLAQRDLSKLYKGILNSKIPITFTPRGQRLYFSDVYQDQLSQGLSVRNYLVLQALLLNKQDVVKNIMSLDLPFPTKESFDLIIESAGVEWNERDIGLFIWFVDLGRSIYPNLYVGLARNIDIIVTDLVLSSRPLGQGRDAEIEYAARVFDLRELLQKCPMVLQVDSYFPYTTQIVRNEMIENTLYEGLLASDFVDFAMPSSSSRESRRRPGGRQMSMVNRLFVSIRMSLLARFIVDGKIDQLKQLQRKGWIGKDLGVLPEISTRVPIFWSLFSKTVEMFKYVKNALKRTLYRSVNLQKLWMTADIPTNMDVVYRWLDWFEEQSSRNAYRRRVQAIERAFALGQVQVGCVVMLYSSFAPQRAEAYEKLSRSTLLSFDAKSLIAYALMYGTNVFRSLAVADENVEQLLKVANVFRQEYMATPPSMRVDDSVRQLLDKLIAFASVFESRSEDLNAFFMLSTVFYGGSQEARDEVDRLIVAAKAAVASLDGGEGPSVIVID